MNCSKYFADAREQAGVSHVYGGHGGALVPRLTGVPTRSEVGKPLAAYYYAGDGAAFWFKRGTMQGSWYCSLSCTWTGVMPARNGSADQGSFPRTSDAAAAQGSFPRETRELLPGDLLPTPLEAPNQG